MYQVTLFSLVWLVLLLEYSSPYLLPPSALPLQEVYHHASLPLARLVGSSLTGEYPNLSQRQPRSHSLHCGFWLHGGTGHFLP